jgi:hypothetical protein
MTLQKSRIGRIVSFTRVLRSVVWRVMFRRTHDSTFASRTRWGVAAMRQDRNWGEKGGKNIIIKKTNLFHVDGERGSISATTKCVEARSSTSPLFWCPGQHAVTV